MTMENDEIFDICFTDEFNKIPYIFRFSRTRIKIVMFILAVLILVAAVLSTILMGEKCIIALMLSATCVALVSGWMVLSALFEKRAFKKATDLTFRYRIAERERIADRIRLERM